MLEGKIKWDLEQIPDIDVFIRYQVKSKISNILKKERRIVKQNSCEADQETNDTSKDPLVYYMAEQSSNAIEGDELIQRCRKISADDQECLKILECLIEGMQIREIAEVLNLEPRNIYNIKRRLLYRIEPIILQSFSGQRSFTKRQNRGKSQKPDN